MTTSNSVKAYSMLLNPVPGTTGTGLDQLVELINTDPGLAGANTVGEIAGGAAAADGMNRIIAEAIRETGAGAGGVFTAAEVIQLNAHIRAHHGDAWTALHGDDGDGVETGFHLVQNDGATGKFRGDNVIDTVADGIYHLGFPIQDGRFLNEDGAANASVEQVARWLTTLFTDRATTGTGFDRITNTILADKGLAMRIPEADISGGADAADDLNQLILDGIAATGAGADGGISADDVRAINAWIREDTDRYDTFVRLHGDDEANEETGFHLVQNDGASTTMFGRNFVNTVADAIYHIGFEIQGDRFVNEDGNANETVEDVASWLDYFYSDQSSTGTGLDRIVDTIKADRGLARNTPAADINNGAGAANTLNGLIIEAAGATNAHADGWITIEDLTAMNGWVRGDAARLANFVALHGDDEDGAETGFHLVQNDGATTTYFGENLVNTVADGLYHFGFEIEDGRFFNEDGDPNATLSDVSAWLNYFIGAKTIVFGTEADDDIAGTDASEHILGEGGDDAIGGGGASDLIYGGWGCDTLGGGDGNDILYGQWGSDDLDGGEGDDVYRVSGNLAGGWSSFEDYDVYFDSGTGGSDRIEAVGAGDVDIGLRAFGPANGIETIDGSGAGGTVRLLGDWESNNLDFSGATLTGSNIVIDGGHGDDTIVGSSDGDTIRGGGGDDWQDGGDGGDTYEVTGNEAGGWDSFQGHDTYADSGATGEDRIVAIGEDVDIGLAGFGPSSGIEVIDGSGASGEVRLLGDWDGNVLDFTGVTLAGGNIVIDGGHGDDIIRGSSGDDQIAGGGGDDDLDGGEGGDTYRVTGNEAGGWSSFQGYDAYRDTGSAGTDRIVAIGEDVDVGLDGFGPASGIEEIDGSGAMGTVRLLGGWDDDILDFRKTAFIGSNIVIDGGYGDDAITGNQAANTITGGGGCDTLDGAGGGDTYEVTGNSAGGWSSFQDYDSYRDSGGDGIDRIVARGDDVDIGLAGFGPQSGIEAIDGTGASGRVRLLGNWEGDVLDFSGTSLIGGNIVIDGHYGSDTITGSAEANTIVGGGGDDWLDGGEGGDTYLVTGNAAGGWSSFQDYDTYRDSGRAGTDRIAAIGTGNVDIGLRSFGPQTGIEVIDGTGATGKVRLLGDWDANLLDFRGTTFKSANVYVDGAGGNDTIYGTAAAEIIVGGTGRDFLDAGGGGDIYHVTGNVAGGWSSFADHDTYADSGKSGTDRIKASGAGNVDIGLLNFSKASGIEVIDGSGASGKVRLLGDSTANNLDFSAVTMVGSNILIDGGHGDDTIKGSAQADIIRGGNGNDILSGGLGPDAFLFDAALSKWSNLDRILDFSVVDDTIRIDDAIFTKAGRLGTLAAGAFAIGAKAADALDRIVYDKTTGNLFYDADGSGAGVQVQFAKLSANLALTQADFLIV